MSKNNSIPASQEAGKNMTFVAPVEMPVIDLSRGKEGIDDMLNNGGTGPQGHRGAPKSQTADKSKKGKKRKKKKKASSY